MTDSALAGSFSVAPAGADDLEAIVAIYADDVAGGHGDGWNEETAPRYRAVFARLDANPDYALYVARLDGRVVGTFLLHFYETLVGVGGRSCTLHAVGVAADCRGRGIGTAMLAAAEEAARVRGARSLRLTSALSREDAHRFYRAAGYIERYRAFAKRL